MQAWVPVASVPRRHPKSSPNPPPGDKRNEKIFFPESTTYTNPPAPAPCPPLTLITGKRLMPGELNSANTTPRSTGPRTPALNARASLNALKHGRTSGNHPALLTIDRNRLIQTLRSTRLPAPTPANREQRERVFSPSGPRTPAGDAKKCAENLLFRPRQPIDYIDAYTQIGTPNELHSNPGETLVKPWSNPGQTPIGPRANTPRSPALPPPSASPSPPRQQLFYSPQRAAFQRPSH
jgi:hypothetical protein